MKKTFLTLILFVFVLGITKTTNAVEPVFNYIDSDWLEPLTQNMTDFWGMAGLQESGINYYSSAKGFPYWKRFDPESPRYQAWFGVYIVDNFEFVNEWKRWYYCKKKSRDRVIKLTMADQIAWLTYSGNPNPEPQLLKFSVSCHLVRHGWYKVFYILKSSVDFGTNTPFPFAPDFNDYTDIIEPYHDIFLYCNVYFKYSKKAKQLLVIYSAIGQYELKDGAWKYPSHKVLKEICKMRKGVSFR